MQEQGNEEAEKIKGLVNIKDLERIEEKGMALQRERKSFWKGVITTAVFMLAIVAVVAIVGQFKKLEFLSANSNQVEGQNETGLLSKESLQKINILEDNIKQNYYQEVDTKELENGLYKGLVAATNDPYSAYYTKEEWEDIKEQNSGIYSGIGSFIGMDMEIGYPLLTRIMEGTPAEESGLLAGDYIYKVNDEDVRGQELSELVAKVKGVEGTTVNLTIIRESEELEFVVERRRIESPTVYLEMLEGDIAYIELISFDTITTRQFEEALKTARSNNMSGLILDLRNNPGGNLETVNDIARMLLPEGLIVYTEDKYGERVEYTCDGSQEIEEPLVVLVNDYSASASEVLAGAIQDYEVGTILGTTTFGKGIVQNIVTLSDGTAVKLTVSNYYTPKGNNIHEVGVEPDEVLEFDGEAYLAEETDNQLSRAIEILGQ